MVSPMNRVRCPVGIAFLTLLEAEPADEGAADAEEDFADVGSALPADPQAQCSSAMVSSATSRLTRARIRAPYRGSRIGPRPAFARRSQGRLGLSAEGLYRKGFEGRVTLLGAEAHLPYDRPPLPKQILSGDWDPERTRLRTEAILSDLDIELALGESAVGLDAATRTVKTDRARELRADAVVIATGIRPRVLPGSAGLEGLHLLRTMEDALKLRTELLASRRSVVVGDGVLGAEIAATATEQAGAVAANILGDEKPYTPVPYFWTDQFDVKIQVYGLPCSDESEVVEDRQGRRVPRPPRIPDGAGREVHVRPAAETPSAARRSTDAPQRRHSRVARHRLRRPEGAGSGGGRIR